MKIPSLFCLLLFIAFGHGFGINNATGFGVYGRWCGLNHGGYSDCCSGHSCAQCKPQYPPSQECLEGFISSLFQLNYSVCPPIDPMDTLCAYHDSCWELYPPGGCSLLPGKYGECSCDCTFIQGIVDTDPCLVAANRRECKLEAFGALVYFCNKPCHNTDKSRCYGRLKNVCSKCP